MDTYLRGKQRAPAFPTSFGTPTPLGGFSKSLRATLAFCQKNTHPKYAAAVHREFVWAHCGPARVALQTVAFGPKRRGKEALRPKSHRKALLAIGRTVPRAFWTSTINIANSGRKRHSTISHLDKIGKPHEFCQANGNACLNTAAIQMDSPMAIRAMATAAFHDPDHAKFVACQEEKGRRLLASKSFAARRSFCLSPAGGARRL